MSDEIMLPGMEELATGVDVRPGDCDMTDEKIYTAERLFKQHQRVFQSAARLLFNNGLSERSVAAALYLSVNTVRAIRDMVLKSQSGESQAAAAALFLKNKASRSRKVLQLRALEVIQDRLEDEKKCKEIGVEALLSVIKTVDTLEGPTETKKNSVDEGEIIDVVDVFDEALNGLNEGENPRARESVADSAADGGNSGGPGADRKAPECSTRSGTRVKIS